MLASKTAEVELSKLTWNSVPPKTLEDLPYELKEMIAIRCDDLTAYHRLRACNKLFYSMPACKYVSFSEYQSLLKKIKEEIWEFGSDYERYEKEFWHREGFTNDEPARIGFQSRAHLDLLSLTQDQYLYVCRNALKFEVCRIVKAVLLDTQEYSHICLTYAVRRGIHRQCHYYLGYSITANDVDLKGAAEIVQILLRDGRIDPSADNKDVIGLASRNGRVDIVRLLLQDERVNPSADDNFAISKASECGHVDIVRLLLQDERVNPSADYNFAIRKASECGHVDILRLLLQDERVNPSADENDAITVASRCGYVDVVRLLFQDERVYCSYLEKKLFT